MDINQLILSKMYFQVCKAVFAAVTDVFEVMQLSAIDISPALLCPCSKVTETHSAPFKQFETKCFLQCFKSRKSLSAQRKHTVLRESMWFGATVTEKNEVTSPKLLQLKIDKKIIWILASSFSMMMMAVKWIVSK